MSLCSSRVHCAIPEDYTRPLLSGESLLTVQRSQISMTCQQRPRIMQTSRLSREPFLPFLFFLIHNMGRKQAPTTDLSPGSLPADHLLVQLGVPKGSNNFLCTDTDGAERLVELGTKIRKTVLATRGESKRPTSNGYLHALAPDNLPSRCLGIKHSVHDPPRPLHGHLDTHLATQRDLS